MEDYGDGAGAGAGFEQWLDLAYLSLLSLTHLGQATRAAQTRPYYLGTNTQYQRPRRSNQQLFISELQTTCTTGTAGECMAL